MRKILAADNCGKGAPVLTIIYEDEDLMVIDKPADMPIHPSINNYDNTLANALMWYFEKQGQPFVYRCINRLDRDTTGLFVAGKEAPSGEDTFRYEQKEGNTQGVSGSCGRQGAGIGCDRCTHWSEKKNL
ncbi:MAG: pseudouridine synthase [Lachnospiraceae bacterium]